MAPPGRGVHVWVGAETGALKGVNLRKKEATNYLVGGSLSRGDGVCVLCWGDPEETELLLGTQEGAVRRFQPLRGLFSPPRRLPLGGPLCGLGICGSSLLTGCRSGLLQLWPEEPQDQEKAELELQAGEGLWRLRQDPSRPQVVATGGRENCLKIWDLQRPAGGPLFRAKNVRNDWLDLRVPVWDWDLQFLPGSRQVVTCTAHRQVRLYDPSSPRRRPVLETSFGEGPLTALALLPGGQSVVVGSARGEMGVIDLRQGRLLRCLRGLWGGVRGLQCHPRRPLVASCGLDRFLRLHQLGDGGLRHKVYLKSRLSCLLLSTQSDWEEEEEGPDPPRAEEGEGEEEGEGKEGEGDELWDSLERIQTPPEPPPREKRGRKRKNLGT